jgi:hypothetical protein
VEITTKNETIIGGLKANYTIATEKICLGGADDWGFSWTGFCLENA